MTMLHRDCESVASTMAATVVPVGRVDLSPLHPKSLIDRHVPPKVKETLKRNRFLVLFLWIGWKVVALGLMAYVWKGTTELSIVSGSDPKRLLYIVTSLAEYNNGRRETIKGQDRLKEVVLPVVVDSLESLQAYGYHVDLYLILAYELRPERRDLIQQSLPPGVGLMVWDDACPLGYDKSDKVQDNTRALARQHRYVIKDYLDDYDVFLPFEDDMRLTGPHVTQYLWTSHQLDVLRQAAPTEVPDEDMDPAHQKFFGDLSRRQLERFVPGFVRVEVLLNETEHGAQLDLDPIPLDYQFDSGEVHLDPTTCCHVQTEAGVPKHPTRDQVVIWETNVRALSVRRLPEGSDLDWVALLPGPGKHLSSKELVGGYWSGRTGAFGDPATNKPSPGMPDLIAQQGGWMATKEQIFRMHTGDVCQGTFLPPFDGPVYRRDGQESMNVEFWSGGYQFFTGVKGGCNMQRVVSLRHPNDFGKHLIYHVANNKQRQLARKRMLRAEHLLGQLNTVRKRAEAAMERIKKGLSE